MALDVVERCGGPLDGRQKLFGIHLQRAVGQRVVGKLQIVAPVLELSASQREVVGFERVANLLAPVLYQSIVCTLTITI